jgi:hypothetical protein
MRPSFGDRYDEILSGLGRFAFLVAFFLRVFMSSLRIVRTTYFPTGHPYSKSK